VSHRSAASVNGCQKNCCSERRAARSSRNSHAMLLRLLTRHNPSQRCTFTPRINKLSRKLDAKQYRNNLAFQKSQLVSPNGKNGTPRSSTPSASILQLKKDAYDDAMHFLTAAIQHDQETIVGLDDIGHAFDELLSDPDHTKEAELAQTLLADCFAQFPHADTNPPLATSLLDILVSEKNPLDRIENDDMDDESYAAVDVPQSLKARLQKWQLWQKKRDMVMTKKLKEKMNDEMDGCTFEPELNKTTLNIVKKKLTKDKRLLEKTVKEEGEIDEKTGEKRRLPRRSSIMYSEAKRIHKERYILGKEKKKKELGTIEKEYAECRDYPKIAARIDPGSVDIMGIKGAATWFKKVDDAKWKQREERLRQDKMRLRNSGEHLYTSKYDGGLKFAKPFKFKGKKERDEAVADRKFRSVRKAMDETAKKAAEGRKEGERLRRASVGVGLRAMKEDFLAKQLNRHSGPPKLVVEVTTSKGENERLCIWEDDNFEEVAREYGRVNGLSAEGVEDLVSVLRDNMLVVEDMESCGSEEEEEEGDEEAEELGRIYDALDRNSDGTLTPKELVQVLEEDEGLAEDLGLGGCRVDLLMGVFRDMDSDHDHHVSKQEFVVYWRRLKREADAEADEEMERVAEEEEEEEEEERAWEGGGEREGRRRVSAADVNSEFHMSFGGGSDDEGGGPLDIGQL